MPPIPVSIPDSAAAAAQVSLVRQRLAARNAASAALIPGASVRLAAASQQMAERFLRGGRLLAFGNGPYATDAEHVSVEFVHPVIVGKRALPALDLSRGFAARLKVMLRPDDMVMGFAPPDGDPEVTAALAWAAARGAQIFAFGAHDGVVAGGEGAGSGPGSAPGSGGLVASADPFIHQEMVEILYHTLWETVHVFFEHRERGHDVGAAGFLYPYLSRQKQDTGDVLAGVAASIRAKAEEDVRLRDLVAAEQAEHIAGAALVMRRQLERGGKLILFGNGGSATDANDWALDCAAPPAGLRSFAAISLAMEPANVTAVANDIGVEAVFLRQLIAHAESADVAVAISTSGGSANVIAALVEARKRGLATIAVLGYGGGEIVRRGLVDVPLVVPCDYIPRIQEIQASIYHVLIELAAGPAVGFPAPMAPMESVEEEAGSDA